jgi:arylsulfate sulfotransferase
MIIPEIMKRLNPRYSALLLVAALSLMIYGCSDSCSNKITDIHISSHGGNALKIEINVHTTEMLNVVIKYWPIGDERFLSSTTTSPSGKNHKVILTNLKPFKQYGFRIVVSNEKCVSESKDYSFTTLDYPLWITDIFKIICPDSSVVPENFRKGYLMVFRRETPGILFFLNYKGDIVWYHQLTGTGFKVAHFTKDNTIIALLGTEDYQTSYGNEILELSLTGDTLFTLKKGQGDFKQTIHHEVLLNDRNQVVTICSEERILDLRARGGKEADTVKSDGILVMDKTGKQIWKWTVFDVINPLDDKNIVRNKSDWMHANCLNYDTDGNYLLSFYNNGQIWKIDANSGKVIWKFGKGGDIKMPVKGIFDNSHAVHINKRNQLMMFDNGTSKLLSRILAFHLDEKNRSSTLELNIPLPREMYSERMGSAYFVSDSTVIISSTKKNTVVLTNLEGRYLWLIRTGFMPYRAEFIPAERLKPYIQAEN